MMQLLHDASPKPVENVHGVVELWSCVWTIGSRRLRRDGRKVQGDPLLALSSTLVMQMMKMADVSKALSDEKELRKPCLHQAGTFAH